MYTRTVYPLLLISGLYLEHYNLCSDSALFNQFRELDLQYDVKCIWTSVSATTALASSLATRYIRFPISRGVLPALHIERRVSVATLRMRESASVLGVCIPAWHVFTVEVLAKVTWQVKALRSAPPN